MAYYCYFNGQYYSNDTPLFAGNDLSLLRGYGLFDFFRTYNGKPFRWDDYWARFENSARLLKLPLPVSQKETEPILAHLFELAGQDEIAYRFVLTGGYSADGVHVEQPNLLIRAEPLPKDNPAAKLKGMKVLPYEYVRDLYEIKSTNYVHMILMDDELKQQAASDLLFHKDGYISELTRSNVFLFKNNRLITPDDYILKGITRKVVLELAAPHFEIEIRPVSLEEVLAADEVFTTSSTKWVMPITQIGEQNIGTGKPGNNTLKLQELFEGYTKVWGSS